MKQIVHAAALLVLLGLTACEKPVVVNVPPPVAVPGPAGPAGTTGAQGSDGAKGEVGKPGEGTTVVIVPAPASAPSN